jgi:hypothetical protein
MERRHAALAKLNQVAGHDRPDHPTIANVSGTGGVKSRPTLFRFCTKKIMRRDGLLRVKRAARREPKLVSK